MWNVLAYILWATVPIGLIAGSLEYPLFVPILIAFYGGLLWIGMKIEPKDERSRRSHTIYGDNKY